MPGTRDTGWELMRSYDGNLIQSGVRSRPGTAYQDLSNTMGWMTRAVVLAVYFSDQDTRNGWVKGLQRTVLCDVRTYGRYSRFLAKVPVLQHVQGLHDQDLYVPRPSRINIEGGDAVGQPSGKTPPTSAEKLDGDHVLVGFLDNDPNQPVVLPFVMAHPKANRPPTAADGRQRRIRFQGTLLEFDQNGNFTVDATGAAKEELGPGGAEVSNSGTGGKVLWKTKDALGRLTSVHLDNLGRILLGSDPNVPATEPIPVGNVLKAWQERILNLIIAHTHGTGVGPSSTPLNAVQFTTEKGRIAEHLSDFIFGKKTY
jgi:hypothetical protein